MSKLSVAEKMLHCTVRIETITSGGGKGTGTGFCFEHKIGEERHRFIVTNKHVVKNKARGFIKFKLKSDDKPFHGPGYTLELLEWNDAWFGHPDPDIDIAITLLPALVDYIEKTNVGMEIFYTVAASQHIPSAEQLSDLDALEEVKFVGYPNGMWDQSAWLPIIRTGTTATPLANDFDGKPIFLIDASVFGGSSGSPVFIYDKMMHTTREQSTVFGPRFHFIGVISAVYQKVDQNEVRPKPIPTATGLIAIQKQNIDIGIVIKARTVVETIEALMATWSEKE